MKRPSFQFYPADWRKDPALSSCSLAARGLWVEMMCIAHECEPYGFVVVNGQAMTAAQLSRQVGENPRVVDAALKQLEAAGVFSRDDEGRIYSRRMVRDERVRNLRAAGGKLGGNPALMDSGKDGGKVGDKVNLPANHGETLGVTPSSSSSSSTLVIPLSPKRGDRKKPRTACPDQFEVTPEMSDWAVAEGLPAEQVLPQTERFLDHHRARGNTFVNWRAAWKTWVMNAVEWGNRARSGS